MRQESAFQNRIKPERTKLLGLIPWKRKSSALGYSQAIDATWDWYRKENNKPLVNSMYKFKFMRVKVIKMFAS